MIASGPELAAPLPDVPSRFGAEALPPQFAPGRVEPRGTWRLALRPAFHEGESFVSLMTRGAAQRGVQVSDFAAKVGLASDRALTLEDVTLTESRLGLDEGCLSSWAWVAAGGPRLAFRGTVFSGREGISHRVRVCPRCLAKDRADDGLERDPDNRPWLRAIWSVAFLTHCLAHGCPLVDRCGCGREVDDRIPFDRCAAGHVIQEATQRSMPGALSLTDWTVGALDAGTGKVGSGELSGLTWFDGGRLVMRLGYLALAGRTGLGSYHATDIAQLAGYCDRGWEVVTNFPEGFNALLDKAVAFRPGDEGLPANTVRQRGWNCLDGWLRPADHPLVAELRDAVSDHRRRGVESRASVVASTAAARPPWEPSHVPGPRFHCYVNHLPGEGAEARHARARVIWETVLTPVEMERLELEAGPLAWRPSRLEALDATRRLDLVLSLVGVAAVLGVRLQQARALVASGLLATAWAPDGSGPVCYRTDVARLQEDLAKAAIRAGPRPDDVHVVSLAGRVFTNTLRLILAGLPAHRDGRGPGLVGLLVAASDLRSGGMFDRDRGDALTWSEFADVNGVPLQMVRALSDGGLLETEGAGSFKTVPRTVADAFAELHVSTRSVARAAGVRTACLTAIAKKGGVVPAFVSAGGRLFRREDLPRILALVDAAGGGLPPFREPKAEARPIPSRLAILDPHSSVGREVT